MNTPTTLLSYAPTVRRSLLAALLCTLPLGQVMGMFAGDASDDEDDKKSEVSDPTFPPLVSTNTGTWLEAFFQEGKPLIIGQGGDMQGLSNEFPSSSDLNTTRPSHDASSHATPQYQVAGERLAYEIQIIGKVIAWIWHKEHTHNSHRNDASYTQAWIQEGKQKFGEGRSPFQLALAAVLEEDPSQKDTMSNFFACRLAQIDSDYDEKTRNKKAIQEAIQHLDPSCTTSPNEQVIQGSGPAFSSPLATAACLFTEELILSHRCFVTNLNYDLEVVSDHKMVDDMVYKAWQEELYGVYFSFASEGYDTRHLAGTFASGVVCTVVVYYLYQLVKGQPAPSGSTQIAEEAPQEEAEAA